MCKADWLICGVTVSLPKYKKNNWTIKRSPGRPNLIMMKIVGFFHSDTIDGSQCMYLFTALFHNYTIYDSNI